VIVIETRCSMRISTGVLFFVAALQKAVVRI